MRTLIIGLVFLSFMACKNETSPQKNNESKEIENEQTIKKDTSDSTIVFSEEILELEKEKTKALKRDRLLKAEDDKPNLQELVVSKSFFKEEDQYLLDYKYPYLNEKIDPGYAVFNNFIKENYLNIEKTENQILEDKELLCDTLKINRFRDKRIIDYKIYDVNHNLISVVLYKENYYSGMRYSTYLFDCVNFDLNKHKFIYFDDFFEVNTEEQVYNTINSIIREGIESGDLYYDCWELSKGDFKAYKNNFVVNDDTVTYYFDDCIICPSYTGTYSIEIPIKDILPLIKKFNYHPKLG
ncbi:RsiV family protein [Aquimarina gracilis]|uniref:RsiV family protein n=1 Tax=Aquimarina gracilis TaxID=874422 RepID=A0ABU5ZUS7_9FLAO|nr:RsiV family protein [Aquimarina gracilis]MEB3345001.1 RsiV family protein [Aquimarina gracilis]